MADSEDTEDESAFPAMTSLPVIASLGDLWLLDDHRIFCGDSLDGATYVALFPKSIKAAIVFTDPPYNLPAMDIGKVCEANHGNFSMGSGEMTPGEFEGFLHNVFTRLKENSLNGSIHYVCMDWRHAAELLAAGNCVYDEWKNLCVWNKNISGMGTFYRSQHELYCQRILNR